MNAGTKLSGTNCDKRAAMRWFGFSAGVVLGLTGVAKIWSALGDVRLLTVADPIVGIQFGHLLLAVGLAELVIAAVCLFRKRPLLAVGLVAWMATNFLVYRIGLSWIGWKKPCNCLGNITDALHISPQTADTIMKFVLAYLLIGSYGLLIWHWLKGQAGKKMEDGGLTEGVD